MAMIDAIISSFFWRKVVEGEGQRAGERDGVSADLGHRLVRGERPESPAAGSLVVKLDAAAARTDGGEVGQPGGDVGFPEREK
jgi:hypothetical protein